MASSTFNRPLFNETILKLFRVSIPRESSSGSSIVFGGRSVFNGLLTLYLGSSKDVRFSFDTTFNLLGLRPPPCQSIKSVTVLFHRSDLTGALNENFVSEIKGIDDFVFVDVPHSGLRVPEYNTINTFIANRTANVIKEVITPQSFEYQGKAKIQTTTVFSDNWACPFDSNDTRFGKFFISGGNTINLQMMTNSLCRTAVQVNALSYGTFYRLPYVSGVSMLIFMRNQPAEYGQLYDDISWLSEVSRFEEILSALKDVMFTSIEMPKFAYMTTIDTIKGIKGIHPFNNLNMLRVFQDKTRAPSQFKHEICSRIDNNEMGTSTKSVFETTAYDSSGGNPLRINKPFCFFIIQSSGHIINLGIFTGK